MAFDRQRAARYLAAFDFRNLFVEALGWDLPPVGLRPLVETFDGHPITLTPVVQKKEFYLFRATTAAGDIPPASVCSKVETWLDKRNREHLLVFTDGAQTQQTWLWVRREAGQPLRRRAHTYHTGQPGDSLLQKLEALAVSFAEEEDLTLVEVVGRARAAFNVERATKRFYDNFRQERNAFERFVAGIEATGDRDWYVSVMLNRLMFVYFIQRKGFLDGDPDYLRNRLRRMQNAYGQDRFYSFYRYFLLRLFHDGLGQPARTPELEQLLGRIPYLNGGIFQVHEIEARYPEIQIADEAFEAILDFFDGYQWYLDDRPLRQDNEINPDVLGYIFEKYINQKEMGAYYTKEDITGYISQNTVIPRLFDMAQARCAAAFGPDGPIWTQLRDDPDRYIYAAVRHGVAHDLPPHIAAGLDDVSARGDWNTPTPPSHGLPTEIWRETVARRQRWKEVWLKLAGGQVTHINDLITLNLDIRQFAQDVLERCEGADLLKAFWEALSTITILDPTCGSGAFLFAALNILQPLYEACLERMEMFLAEPGFVRLHPNYSKAFQGVLAQVEKHPNRAYYIFKTIMVNNLYGVDIMPEAVEICKLRLFLKLAAQVEPAPRQANYGIEPLPDIDFNVRAGNTLVGFATEREFTGRLFAQLVLSRIQVLTGTLATFRKAQLAGETTAEQLTTLKRNAQQVLHEIKDELDQNLMQDYGQSGLEAFRRTHQPFHWFTEFYEITNSGGFDVIIGNPPFIEYPRVRERYSIRGFQHLDSGNLYALVMERSTLLVGEMGRVGLIVPISFISIADTITIRKFMFSVFQDSWMSHFAIRPAKLFEGVEQRLTIYLASHSSVNKRLWQTKYIQWYKAERPNLFQTLGYCDVTGITESEFVPKVSSKVHLRIIGKVMGTYSESIVQYLAKNGTTLFFHRTPGYWIRIMDFEPYFRSPTSNRSVHHIREVSVVDPGIAKFIGAFISSSLYFFYFFATGNCRNLTSSDIRALRIGVPSNHILRDSGLLFDRLMNDYNQHSAVKTRGVTEFQEFNWSRSKPIIDEIDRVMARHFKLDEKELDEIVNYDIKYRMGDDLFDNEADEED